MASLANTSIAQLAGRLQQLQAQSSALQADVQQRGAWNHLAHAMTEAYLGQLQQAPQQVRPRQHDPGVLPLREQGHKAQQVFGHLHGIIASDGLRGGSGRLFGFIPGSGLYASALGDYLAAITNRYTGARFAAPNAVHLEQELLLWLASELGYPDTARGDLTSGGSIANLTALVCAREAYAIKPRDIEQCVVYLTTQAHHCIAKALHVLGMGSCVQRYIGMDKGYRMRAELLQQQIVADRRAGLRPWLLIANAGSTDIGAIDPMPELVDIAGAEELWLHVDGAYGAAFALCASGKARLSGMAGSDSLIVDPHKGLFTPFGSGVVLVRAGALLAAALSSSGEYMADATLLAEGAEFDPHQLSLELSRHFRGLRLWLPLQLHGLAVFRAALEEKLLLARYVWERVPDMPGFHAVNNPDLSIIGLRAQLARGDEEAFNRRLLDAVQAEGEVFMTSTRLQGKFVIRLAILALATHRDDVDLALDRLQWHRRCLLADFSPGG